MTAQMFALLGGTGVFTLCACVFHTPPPTIMSMTPQIRRPEETLALRSLRAVLASKPRSLWSVAPADPVLSALQVMSEGDIGCVIGLESDVLVGIWSERACARRMVLARKSPETTPIADIMVRKVVTVDMSKTYAD